MRNNCSGISSRLGDARPGLAFFHTDRSDHMRFSLSALAAASTFSIGSTALAQNPTPPQQPAAPMTFFITSAGRGDGGNLGGLAGADAQCASLAQSAGVQLA